MAYKTTSISFGSIGIKTITTTFLPSRVDAYVGPSFGGEDIIHECFGSSDGVNTLANWKFDDGTLVSADNVNGHLISHWENIGGVLTEVLKVDFSSFNATSLKLNVIKSNANYQIFLRIQS